MKVYTLLTTAVLALVAPALAAPVESATTDSANTAAAGNAPAAAAAAANYGSPQCKSQGLYDLCVGSDNAGAYCDGTGFHNNFMASCKGVCYCA